MADTEGRIGSGGTFVRRHGVEPNSKMTLLRQDLSGANLVTTVGA
jgi:hypothetical protein